MFPILFGLSMDYEVFLLSRIREEYLRTGDNAESVARGLAGTGRVITSAALIMIVVFLSFVASPVPSLKMLGLGLAIAILVDATLVRMVLVPATMSLLGKANWWLPAWLDRVLPHLSVEGPAPRHRPRHRHRATTRPPSRSWSAADRDQAPGVRFPVGPLVVAGREPEGADVASTGGRAGRWAGFVRPGCGARRCWRWAATRRSSWSSSSTWTATRGGSRHRPTPSCSCWTPWWCGRSSRCCRR